MSDKASLEAALKEAYGRMSKDELITLLITKDALIRELIQSNRGTPDEEEKEEEKEGWKTEVICGHEFKVRDAYWKRCDKCGLIKPIKI